MRESVLDSAWPAYRAKAVAEVKEDVEQTGLIRPFDDARGNPDSFRRLRPVTAPAAALLHAGGLAG